MHALCMLLSAIAYHHCDCYTQLNEYSDVNRDAFGYLYSHCYAHSYAEANANPAVDRG